MKWKRQFSKKYRLNFDTKIIKILFFECDIAYNGDLNLNIMYKFFPS